MENVKIPFDEVLRYTGFNKELHTMTKDLEEKINKNIEVIKEKIHPRIIASNILSIEKQSKYIYSEGNIKFTGEDIKEHLKSCDGIILMAATLGNEVDTFLRMQEIKDMADAVIADAAANVAIEHVCQEKEEEIRRILKKENKYLTMRYSPGYGDLPINIQGEILNVLDSQRKIGLAVTPSNIMIPRKSVTSIMGVAEIDVKGKLSGCKNCVLKTKCIYRKRGITCE